jgi:hypothetical protein
MDALEHNRLMGGELLGRIQLLEGRMDAVTALAGMGAPSLSNNSQGPGAQPGSSAVSAAAGPAPPTSSSDAINSSSSSRPDNPGSGSSALAVSGVASTPFTQAKLLRQVATLEQQATVLHESSVQLTVKTEQVCHI